MAYFANVAPLAGMKASTYTTLENQVVLEENGRLYNPTTGHFVGSSATMLECMNQLAMLKLVTVDKLIAMGFHNPLRLIGAGANDVIEGKTIHFDEETVSLFMEG